MKNLGKGIIFGVDSELVILNKYNKGWHTLKIADNYKTVENYEMYCYLRYMGVDAESAFCDKIRELDKSNTNRVK